MFSQRISTVIKLTASILALAAAYLLAGKAGLALAIPPGYATAIFPASGVALAALLFLGWRFWPGIFIGSLALNLWISLAAGHELNSTTLAIAASIGSGAAIQALFGSWLIKRFVGFPSALADEREVVSFLLLGGPLSCLVSATIAIFSLWISGAVPAGNIFFSWWTWWVGDVLGVLLVTTIIITFFGQPKLLWRQRRWSVALPMVIVALGIIPAFIGVSHYESQRVVLEFRKQAALLHQTLESKIQLNLDAIQTLKDFSHGVGKMDFQGFTLFAEGTLARHPSLHAISYNPRVLAAGRSAFEAVIREEVDPAFTIRERRSQGGLVSAGKREEYVTVAYIQPLAANKNALGFDVASTPVRKVALDRARDTGKAVATGSITLVQESRSQKGVLAFLPMFEGKSATLAERRGNIKGYGVGVFRVGDLLVSALGGVDPNEIAARLYDNDPQTGKSFLAGYGGGSGLWEKERALQSGLNITGPWWSQTLNFAGRQWQLEISPTRTVLDSQRSWGGWFVLAGGLLFASFLGAFLLIMTGRTARVEELIRERTGQLADRESRLVAILENAGEGIITMSEQGIIESANPAAAKLFGFTNVEMVGHNVKMLMPSPTRENHDSYLQHFRETGEKNILGNSREVEGLRKDGSPIHVALSVSEVQLADHRIFTGTLHDLTERNRADKLKSEFVSTVSHELRTPLTSIYGGLKMVMAGVAGELPEKAQRLVQLAYNNSERLNLLINDILDIQKMEAGRMELQFQTVNAATLVRRAVEENSGYAEKFSVHYTIMEPLSETLFVGGDESRLCQVLANFLSNAAKFSQAGDSIEIKVEESKPWVQFAVTDHGPGIPEEFQSRVFQKFAQADSSDTRQKGGTGLGLSISKALVVLHNGEIDYITRAGQGTTFFFRLPLVEQDD